MKYYILIVCVLACFALGGCKMMRSAHRSRGVYRSITPRYRVPTPSYRIPTLRYRGPSQRHRSPTSHRRPSSSRRR